MKTLVCLMAMFAVPAAAQSPSAGAAQVTIPNDAADMAEFFQLLDANKDGTVTKAEFDTFAASTAAEVKNDKDAAASTEETVSGLRTLFELMDANNDGIVPRAEFEKFNAMLEAQGGSGD